MPSHYLFFMYAGIVALLVGMLLSVRTSRRKPSSLQMSKSSSSQAAPVAYEDQNQGKERNVNVIFVYNAHAFDAYELLGIPAGSPMKEAEKAYKLIRSQSQSDQLPLIEAALKAIRENS